jgi:hypothetical protein
MLNNSDFNTTTVTSPMPNGPGGNTIVPTPATANEWPKMLIAIAVGASGIWLISTMFSEDAAKWTALITLGGIVTYYETHGNQQFSQGLKDFTGAIPGW